MAPATAKKRARTYGSVGKFIRRFKKPKAELRIFDPAEQTPPPITDAEIASKTFFCIRGHMKSGTNWVGNLLNLHPQVSCVGEFHWQLMTEALEETIQRVNWLRFDDQESDTLRQQAQMLMKRTVLGRADRGAQWIGDRTPGSLDPICFPDAPHIQVIRDGRDVLVSRAFHMFKNTDHILIQREVASDEVLSQNLKELKQDPQFFDKNPKRLLQSEGFVRRTARAWKRNLQKDRELLSRVDNLKLFTVRYEELHQNTSAMRNRLLEFIGADIQQASQLDRVTLPGFGVSQGESLQDALKEYELDENDMPICENSQAPQRAQRRQGFYRRGQSGDWKNYMTEQAQRWFVDEAGDELIRQGYAKTRHW